jgi:hypothetical protein
MGAELIARPPLEVRYEGTRVTAPPVLSARIAELWRDEKQSRPSITNGMFLSVSEIDGGLVTVKPCEYKLFIARERDQALRDALAIRPFAVSGIVLLEKEIVSVVVGRRSADVTEYPGRWELVPSGGVGCEWATKRGTVDVLGALLDELEQEVGIPRSAVREATCLGLAHDRRQDGYDACFALRVDGAEPVRRPEYAELAVLSVLDAFALFREEDVVPTSRVVLEVAHELGLL